MVILIKTAVKAGENVISETILEGIVKANEKVADKIIDGFPPLAAASVPPPLPQEEK